MDWYRTSVSSEAVDSIDRLGIDFNISRCILSGPSAFPLLLDFIDVFTFDIEIFNTG